MHKLFLFLPICFSAFSPFISAQFFYKIDEEFEFNGTDLSLKGHDHTEGCTLLEEYEAYKVYAPKKTTLKMKKYTLSDIRYFTNYQQDIFKIECINLGDMFEEAHLQLDLSEGSKYSGTTDHAAGLFYVYKHMRTTDVYINLEESDTAYVWIMMDWYLDQTKEYRENHTFLPVLGMSAKDAKARDFLFAYEEPSKRTTAVDLKWLYYYDYGLELYFRSDTIMQAKVFNKGELYQKFESPLPFDLTMEDTRKVIREKFGDPPSASQQGNAWYYNKPNLQVHFYFDYANEQEQPTEEDKIEWIVFAVKKD